MILKDHTTIRLKKVERSAWDNTDKDMLTHKDCNHKINKCEHLEIKNKSFGRFFQDKNNNGIPDVFESKTKKRKMDVSKWI